jgi:hypothetical protein
VIDITIVRMGLKHSGLEMQKIKMHTILLSCLIVEVNYVDWMLKTNTLVPPYSLIQLSAIYRVAKKNL